MHPRLRGVKGGGMRSVSEARVDAAPWACSGHSAVICIGGDLRPGDHLRLLGYLRWIFLEKSTSALNKCIAFG